VLFIIDILFHLRSPVLFHLDGGCVCTDYSPEVEGFSFFNPLRNRAPEATADAFLRDVRDGRCPASAAPILAADFCSTPRSYFHATVWKLKHRTDRPEGITLYYAFNGTGEGLLKLAGKDGSWVVTAAEAVY
jgi:hypothetical protein